MSLLRSRLRGALALVAALAFAGASVQAQTLHIVNQVGFSFIPEDITIEVGDVVRWVWSNGDHTVTEGPGPIPTGGEAFNELLAPGQQVVQIVFDAQFLHDNPRPDNLYDYYCIPHFAFDMVGTVTVESPWSNEGNALAGVNGEPQLLGLGDLTAGSAASLELSNAAPNALVGLFASFASTPVPFKGGVLCTVPVALQVIFPIGPSGSASLPTTIPAGIPPGFQTWWQFVIQDAAGPNGFALSNCLLSTFP